MTGTGIRICRTIRRAIPVIVLIPRHDWSCQEEHLVLQGPINASELRMIRRSIPRDTVFVPISCEWSASWLMESPCDFPLCYSSGTLYGNDFLAPGCDVSALIVVAEIKVIRVGGERDTQHLVLPVQVCDGCFSLNSQRCCLLFFPAAIPLYPSLSPSPGLYVSSYLDDCPHPLLNRYHSDHP